MLIGDYASFKGAVTCRKMKRAKKAALKSVIKGMKWLAKEEPGFFIIKNEVVGETLVTTVCLKIDLPTVKWKVDEPVV